MQEQEKGAGLSFPQFSQTVGTTSSERKALAAISSIPAEIMKRQCCMIRGNLVTSLLSSRSEQRSAVFAQFDGKLWFGTAKYFFLCDRSDQPEPMARVDWHSEVKKQKHTGLIVFSTAPEHVDTSDPFTLCRNLGGLALTLPFSMEPEHEDERIGVPVLHSEAYDSED